MGITDQLFVRSLRLFGPKRAHSIASWLLKEASTRRWAKRFIRWKFDPTNIQIPCRFLDYDLASPIGLGAGFDLDGSLLPALGCLGFGAIETGSLQPRTYLDYLDPGLFVDYRLKLLGYNFSLGSSDWKEAAHQISRAYTRGIRGANIAVGQGSIANVDKHFEEVIEMATVLTKGIDYLTIHTGFSAFERENILLDPLQLRKFLRVLSPRLDCPFLVKLPLGLDHKKFLHLAKVALEGKAAGWILGGALPKEYVPHLKLRRDKTFQVSGQPIRESSMQAITLLRSEFGLKPALVASGGIQSGKDLVQAIRLGADFVQVYSSLILRGPGIVKMMHKEARREMNHLGVKHIEDLRGIDLRE